MKTADIRSLAQASLGVFKPRPPGAATSPEKQEDRAPHGANDKALAEATANLVTALVAASKERLQAPLPAVQEARPPAVQTIEPSRAPSMTRVQLIRDGSRQVRGFTMTDEHGTTWRGEVIRDGAGDIRDCTIVPVKKK